MSLVTELRQEIARAITHSELGAVLEVSTAGQEGVRVYPKNHSSGEPSSHVTLEHLPPQGDISASSGKDPLGLSPRPSGWSLFTPP